MTRSLRENEKMTAQDVSARIRQGIARSEKRRRAVIAQRGSGNPNWKGAVRAQYRRWARRRGEA